MDLTPLERRRQKLSEARLQLALRTLRDTGCVAIARALPADVAKISS